MEKYRDDIKDITPCNPQMIVVDQANTILKGRKQCALVQLELEF